MSLYKQFETDDAIEKSGILLSYGENTKGDLITIRIARAGGANEAFQKRMEARVKPLRRQIQNELLTLKEIDKLTLDVYCETVVLGWENVEDKEGNDMPFTVENAKKLFTELPDLFKDVQEQAQRSASFRKSLLEADAGN